ncbi:MAG: DUF2341 domain-containing protein, partial [Fuerstiella sp.]|nr:DUF2341 domain-containing protein [Fuerstiella sp.]
MMRTTLLWIHVTLILTFGSATARSQYDDWKYSGSLFLLTTPDGADISEQSQEQHFPVLIRLNSDWFDFAQAQPNGDDVRFVTPSGKHIPFQTEHWDAAAGSAALWVRIPEIRGNSHQEIRMLWGNPQAEGASDGGAVFSAANGYLSVWHMGRKVRDVAGTLESSDTGTTETLGIVGRARHFSGGRGIFCGDQILTFPSGGSVHSSQAWFRPETSNGRVLGWGNEKAQGKVVMQYRSPPHVMMECYFSDANVAGPIDREPRSGTRKRSAHQASGGEWIHTVHTYQRGKSLVYINGVLAGTGNP